MTFLQEDMDFDSIENKIITENINGQLKKQYYLIGPHAEGGIKNGNGRTYPVPILEKNVIRLNEKEIPMKRMLGECGHPDCHTESAKILTESGWKYLKNISDDENVITLNTSTNEIEIHTINKKIDQYYSGKMIHIKTRSIDTIVTPNHRFLVVDRYNNSEYITAQSIMENPIKYGHYYIPKLGNWIVDSPDTFILKGLSGIPKSGNYNIDPAIDSTIDMKTFVRFIGIWLAEGHTISNEKKGMGYKTNIGITQKNKQVSDEIRELLKSFPPEMKWAEYTKKDGTNIFTLLDLRLAEYLRNNFGSGCYNKHIPLEIKSLSAEYLEELLEWFLKGDGRNYTFLRGKYTSTIKNVFTTSEILIHDLNEILFKSGGSGNLTTVITKSDYMFAGHLIKAENKSPLHQLNFSSTKGIHLDPRFIQVEEIDFTGNVYCVSVTNQNFYCMDNGKTFWSGNSLDINYERVTHCTESLVMDGNLAIGKSFIFEEGLGKIIRTLIDRGTKICTSTRGTGTLKESVVQNDFLWKTNDLVHDPSGPSCFLDIVAESKEWVIENGLLVEKDRDELLKKVDKVILEHQFSIEDRRAAFLKLFNETINKIKNKNI